MATPRATRMTKNRARILYEVDGESYAAIGRELGYKSVTISAWAKADGGWAKPTSGTPAAPAVAFNADEEAEAEVASTIERGEADLRDRLTVLEADNARLEAENAELKPTYDISAMLEDRVQWLTDNSPEGDRFWLNRAEAKFKQENRSRAKDGLPVFDIKDHPEMLDDLIIELKTKEATARQRPITEPASRRIKMFIMRNGMPTIEPIPLEGQVNNMAGSLADGIVRYTRKGFKLTDPFLCPRAGCYQPAATNEMGNWMFASYCTENHRLEVEGPETAGSTGVSVRDVVASGIR